MSTQPTDHAPYIGPYINPYADRSAVEETPEQAKARIEAHNAETMKRFRFFHRTVTQGEWIAISRALDMTRPQIEGDSNLTLLALAYVKEKRDHGAASWDLLLAMTDEDILKLHGFDTSLLADEDADEGE